MDIAVQGLLGQAYVVVVFASQILLLTNFIMRLWRPAIERRWGWVVYATGIPALALGLLNLAHSGPWLLTAGLLLYALWAALGWTVDTWRNIPWRSPPRWPIFIPYVALLVGSLLLFWISLWYVGLAYWIAFGVLYAVQTALNLASHRKRSGTKQPGG